MMKTTRRMILPALLVCTAALSGFAAGHPGNMSGDTALITPEFTRLSLGATVEGITRQVQTPSSQEATLEAFAYSGNIGIDVFRWLTVFGSAGVAELDSFEGLVPAGTEYDTDSAWSGGLQVNLWQIPVREPEFMRGRLLIRTLFEYASYASSSDAIEVSWTDTSLAVPIGYEIYSDRETLGGVFSLLLSAGPLYSVVDGTLESGSLEQDFEESEDFGLFAAADVFITVNVMAGASLQYFDDGAFSAYVRYHF